MEDTPGSPFLTRLEQRSGYLHMLTGKMFSKWKRRWFQISQFKLFYYRKERDLEHLGSMDLRQLDRIEVNPKRKELLGQENVLVLHFIRRSPLVLQMVSREELQAWHTTLRAYHDSFMDARARSFQPASKATLKHLKEVGAVSHTGVVRHDAQSGHSMAAHTALSLHALPLARSVSTPAMHGHHPTAGARSLSDALSPRSDADMEQEKMALGELDFMLDLVAMQEAMLYKCVKRIDAFKTFCYHFKEDVELRRAPVAMHDVMLEVARRFKRVERRIQRVQDFTSELMTQVERQSEGGAKAGSLPVLSRVLGDKVAAKQQAKEATLSTATGNPCAAQGHDGAGATTTASDTSSESSRAEALLAWGEPLAMASAAGVAMYACDDRDDSSSSISSASPPPARPLGLEGGDARERADSTKDPVRVRQFAGELKSLYLVEKVKTLEQELALKDRELVQVYEELFFAQAGARRTKLAASGVRVSAQAVERLWQRVMAERIEPERWSSWLKQEMK